MTFIILFEDAPDADPAIRKTHMPDHLAFLQAHRDVISAAGPLFSPQGDGRGGMWVITTPDASAAQALVEADPFWPTGLRKSVTILEWRQVFADGVPLIAPG